MALDPREIYELLLLVLGVSAVVIFISLQFFVTAAYGRHDDGERAWWWGPGIPTRWSWVLMEFPASLGFALFFFLGERSLDITPLILFGMWQAHYFHRSFIYPFQRRTKPGGTTPLLIPLSGMLTNLGIAFVNASILTWISIRADYDLAWLTDPRFILGAIVFASGFYINRKADSILANLRKPGETGYRIPRGWLYEKISCPNYFGELLIWTGWAIATWSLAGVAFLLITAANLVPRAFSNHAWYLRKFDDYPSNRKAIFPGLI
mgnify:CR=1 FL=1